MTAGETTGSVGQTLAFLLALEGRVSRRAYALTGFGLMAFKYAVEALAFRLVTGSTWTPLEYFSPLVRLRQSKLEPSPTWFLLALGLWTLPFVWIGASMTLRRARDAGLSGSTVLLFFVPFLNYAWMLVLACLAPDRRPEPVREAATGDQAPLAAALTAVAVSAVVGLVAMAFSVYVARSYGNGLFLGTPFLMGFVGGHLLNRQGDHGLPATLRMSALATFLAGLLLLLFALEGLVCIAMAAGLALPLVLFGALFGRALALGRARRARHTPLLALLFLPPIGLLEGRLARPLTFEVVTSVEVAAPPERVWPHVLAFPELPPPEDWLFATGVAYPVRARIEGQGVGAVRRCEFSTGAFVEPITAWEPGRRLAFDVNESPLPLQEWSPHAGLRPPHLERSFRSVRGEFRLVPLPGGRTRLEGSTWYELELYPVGYWRLLSDRILHRIHLRVLEHVRRLSE